MPTPPPDNSGNSTRERRQHFRAPLVPNFELQVRVWKIPPRISLSVRPMPSQELRITPIEMSIGGMSIAIPGVEPDALPADASDRLRIELRYPDGELLLEGKLRTTGMRRLEDGTMITGIQFRKSENRLGAIVNALQRAELRLRRGVDDLPVPSDPTPAGAIAAARA